MTSASLRSGVSSSLVNTIGASTWSGWSVGKAAPTLRLVHTRAPIASASATRCFHAVSSRDTRPARISGRFAALSHSAACRMASAGGALVTGGM